MASNALERVARACDGGAAQLLAALRAGQDAIESYNVRGLSAELGELQPQDLLITSGQGITKERLADGAILMANALYYLRGVASAGDPGKTILDTAPLNASEIKALCQKLAV